MGEPQTVDEIPDLFEYTSHFGEEIGRLAAAACWPLPNSQGGPCPEGEWMEPNKAAQDENCYLCSVPTCPVCSFCFKYHHPQDSHGAAKDFKALM